MRRIKVGVLGATGSVGQRFVQLLASHPWFEIAALFASERSAGKEYREVAKWFLPCEMPENVAEMEVRALSELEAVRKEEDVEILFSALPSEVAAEVEKKSAELGYAVASNVSVHRMDEDVPLVIPEVNAEHLALIETQRERRGWDGFIITNPNCSSIMLTLTLKPLMRFGIEEVRVATMQAVSGAGYAGVPSMAIIDNVIPFIAKEEEKMETEPLKILGTLENGRVKPASFSISASCHRVPVLDGHTEAVWVRFSEEVSVDEVKNAFKNFRSELKTPFAPEKPLILREEPDRPQPRLDRDAGSGMSVSIGRIRASSGGGVGSGAGRGERERRRGSEVKYIVLGHNTIRGAAGASILNAELLVEREYV